MSELGDDLDLTMAIIRENTRWMRLRAGLPADRPEESREDQLAELLALRAENDALNAEHRRQTLRVVV